MQPQGARSGTFAFVTGPAAAPGVRDTFVHDGRTTLESPVFDASAWREPRLRYWVSFAGMQANPVAGGVVPSPNSRLIVLGRVQDQTTDGGQGDASAPGGDAAVPGDWVEIERLENVITDGWTHRTVALPPALAGGRVKLRFVAEDANAASGGVEAAIDDVEITSNVPACYQVVPPGGGGGGGGGCSLGGAGGAGGAGTLGLLLLALVARFRRKPAPTRRAPA